MIRNVATDLYAAKAPLEWAVIGNGILFTTQIPIDRAGQVVEGGIDAQARQTLDNLQHTLEKAGAGLDALVQVLIYVTDREHLAAVNRVYAEYIKAPYPNRGAVIVSGFARPEMLIEVIAYAAMTDEQ